MTIHTPNRRGGVGTSDLMATPMGYSPKSSLFSGSAQLLMNSPIQTPLALREAIGKSFHWNFTYHFKIKKRGKLNICCFNQIATNGCYIIRRASTDHVI